MPATLTDAERIILQNEGKLPRLLFVLVGPSGVGKNTIIKKLLTNNPYMDRIRTYTTRPARPGETPGEQYHFVDFEQFRQLALDGKLMEADASIAGRDVYGLGALYSMPNDLFVDVHPERHLVIAEVDMYGMRRLKRDYPDCVTIFLTAPPDVLYRRIMERPDEHMNESSMGQRMLTAQEQMRSAGECDYLVLNEGNHADETVEVIEAIVLAERSRIRPGVDLLKTIPPETFGEWIVHNDGQ